ncbi:ANTAR domain-containing protein [Nocardioides scoriae]|uniref:ANTAR domain-containing protein n=1 Tax=Nocardioides scoriae TaxID=642780 RepID=A0A1H1NR43_9ACTN|nr:ANTAR domain-containing protein [Nocardioides scoriae]SDS01451.1 ANTAR domain-containing protein [Nocardioides scoriae]
MSPTNDTSALPVFGQWGHDFATGAWWFSDEVVRLWDIPLPEGCGIDAVLPRLHPDDVEGITRSLEHAVAERSTLAGQGRLLTDSRGERVFSFVGEVVPDEQGEPRTLEGWSLDVTDEVRVATRSAVDAATRHRRAIEQVKGALMVTYRIDEVTAFAILRKQSNEHNVKINDLAEHVSRAMGAGVARPQEQAAPMMELLEAVGRRLRRARQDEAGDGTAAR